MDSKELLEKIKSKETDSGTLALEVIANLELLPTIFEGLTAKAASLKYGCEKILRTISEKKPEVLYPQIEFFIKNLESENNLFRLGATRVLANLARVDTKNKIDAAFETYFAPLPGPELMNAGNVIDGSIKIAAAKPELINKIIKELLKVETARYKTEECRNIALGKVVSSFDSFFDKIENKEPVIALIKKQLNNSRKATQKKAEAFVKRHHVI